MVLLSSGYFSINDNGGMDAPSSKPDFIDCNSSCFGFYRTDRNITQSMEKAWSYLLASGRAKERRRKIDEKLFDRSFRNVTKYDIPELIAGAFTDGGRV